MAATGLALLPFLASSITNRPMRAQQGVDYSKTVDAGLKYLLGKQDAQGRFGDDTYGHALATVAVCETYGLTSDPRLKRSAQLALNSIASSQDVTTGGWRSQQRQEPDLVTTGWHLMALKSGQMAGLAVPRTALQRASRFLDSVESRNKGRFSYYPGQAETPAMTAVGLLCRMYGGVTPRNPALAQGVSYLQQQGPPARSTNMAYLYFATQVMHHMGGEPWKVWNLGPGQDVKGGMPDSLISRQDTGKTPGHNHQAGSWEGSDEGGRLTSTALALLCLEVYYRQLPLHRRDGGRGLID
jgi:hypothetical protein